MKNRLGLLWVLAATSASAIGCGGSDDTSSIPGGTGGAGGGSAGKSGAAGTAGKAGSGGVAGSGTGGSTGGTTGKGGSAGSTGGKGGSAGSTGGSAGASGKGGAGGTAGGSAGASGKGGSAGGTAGASGKGGSAGGTAGAGGSAGGTAGAAGTGGSTGGASGTGGSAGGTAGSAGSGGGAPTPCMGTNTACLTTGGNNGLCVGGFCGDCVSPADDATCVAAYAGAADVCANGSCVKCDAVTDTWVVDPVNGNDMATGSGKAGGAAAGKCALKTVSAAIKAINAVGGAGPYTIEIVGPNTPAASDVYPWVIPAHTTLTTTGLVTVPGVNGNNNYVIRLNKPGSGIDAPAGLVIDLAGATGQPYGIDVNSGADDTTFLRNVTVQNSPGNGIIVSPTAAGSAHVTIGEGFVVKSNGKTAMATRSGMIVGNGDSLVTIDVAAGKTPTVFEDNGNNGILVQGTGGIVINGVPSATIGDGTVVTKANGASGISITTGGNAAKQNTITGLVAFGNGVTQAGNGLVLNATSLVKVRDSVSLANSQHGISVVNQGGGLLMLGVDLGTALDGKNLVQHTNAEGNINLGVGICFQGAPMAVLPAQGNSFGAAKDCSTTTATLTPGTGMNGCTGGHDYGASAGSTVDIKSCKLRQATRGPPSGDGARAFARLSQRTFRASGVYPTRRPGEGRLWRRRGRWGGGRKRSRGGRQCGSGDRRGLGDGRSRRRWWRRG